MSAPKLTGNRCQCTACGKYFNGAQPFDKHRVGEYGVNRHCLTVAEMGRCGWKRNVAGFWCERAKEPPDKPCARRFPARFPRDQLPTPCPDPIRSTERAGARAMEGAL